MIDPHIALSVSQSLYFLIVQLPTYSLSPSLHPSLSLSSLFRFPYPRPIVVILAVSSNYWQFLEATVRWGGTICSVLLSAYLHQPLHLLLLNAPGKANYQVPRKHSYNNSKHLITKTKGNYFLTVVSTLTYRTVVGFPWVNEMLDRNIGQYANQCMLWFHSE